MRILRRLGVLCALAVACTGFGGASLAGEASPPSLPPLAPQPSAPPQAPAATVQLVPFEKLKPLLPDPPEGWKAEPTGGSTTESEDLKFTTAERTYYKGDDENAQTASITIIDFAGNKTYFETATAAWKLNSETPEGYDKPVEIDGLHGFEHYAKALKGSSLSVIVGGRYFVQVEMANQDPKDLREWLKRIDLKKLAELK